jgi:hypothetical protein
MLYMALIMRGFFLKISQNKGGFSSCVSDWELDRHAGVEKVENSAPYPPKGTE